MCPSEAPPAARGRGRPPNTLSLVRLGRGSGGAAGISCHRLPSPPSQGTHRPSSQGTQRLSGTKQEPPEVAVPRGAGGPAPKGCWQLDAPPSAGHVLLEKVPLRQLQVPAETRLKNVQNAVFASFPSCVSQRVPQTGHFLTVWLWLSCSGIILIGKQDYKLVRGQNLPTENTCARRRSRSRLSAPEMQAWRGPGWHPSGRRGGTSETPAAEQLLLLKSERSHQIPDGEENPQQHWLQPIFLI